MLQILLPHDCQICLHCRSSEITVPTFSVLLLPFVSVSQPSFIYQGMPAFSIESLVTGSVHIEDKKDHPTSNRALHSSHDRCFNFNRDRHTLRAYPRPLEDDKLDTETKWVPNNNSTKSGIHNTARDSLPPTYPDPLAAIQLQSLVPMPMPISMGNAPTRCKNISVRRLLPFIMPQNPRDGGFCHAYALLLEKSQVSQKAFFFFLDDFDR